MSEPRRSAIEAILSTWLPVATAVAGALWAVFIFSANQRDIADQDRDQRGKENVARLIEARKPLFERQMQLYTLVIQLSGKIVVTDPSSSDWNGLLQDYTRLMVSDASLLADQKVAEAMAEFRVFALKKKKGDDSRYGYPESFTLGRAMRAAIQSSWLNGLSNDGTLLPPLPLVGGVNEKLK